MCAKCERAVLRIRVCVYAPRSVYRIYRFAHVPDTHYTQTDAQTHTRIRARCALRHRCMRLRNILSRCTCCSRVARALSPSRLAPSPLRVHQSLVRAYISKPVVTAPPRRYLSHASGADFYRRGDSRGKFIKSLLPAPPRAHHALSRGLGGRGCSSSSYLYLYFLRLSVA